MARKEFPNDDIAAFIGKGTSFKGIITYDGSIRIDGKVEGEIISQGSLIVGESANIEADVSVSNIVCAGKINGNVQASEKVHLQSTASLSGSLNTPNLVIDQGVTFNGQCEMKKPPLKKKNT
ncbi:MAG: polymer-forming cytoskeletal protein [Nitrospiria bacterium]